MSVVLRCPNCGTTRATAGECEACRDAQVRYFCTNHTPGLWLDDGVCRKCGSRFGAASRVSTRTMPATPLARRATAAPVPIPASAPDPVPAAAPERKPAPVRPPAPISLGSRPLEVPAWQAVLNAVLRARSAARDRERPPIAAGAGGCLRRLLIIVLLLSLGLLIGLFLFGRALMHNLQLY